MDDYAGRVLADRYRLPLPPSDEYELAESRAFDTYSGQEVLVRQVPLPEIVEAEVLDDDGPPDLPEGFVPRAGATGGGGVRRASARTTRSPADPAVRRAMEAAQTAAQIPDHPRLDQVFDVFAEGGSLWIVSELVAARPLAALLADRPLSPYRAAEVAADVLAALRVLHGHGWVHRNITARTVLICDDGRVMLTGLAAGAAEEALCGYDPRPVEEGEATGSAGSVGNVASYGDAGAHGDENGDESGWDRSGGEGPGLPRYRDQIGIPDRSRGAELEPAPESAGRPPGEARAGRAGAIAAYRAGARAAGRVNEEPRGGGSADQAGTGAGSAGAGVPGARAGWDGSAYDAGGRDEEPAVPGRISDPYGVGGAKPWHGAVPRAAGNRYGTGAPHGYEPDHFPGQDRTPGQNRAPEPDHFPGQNRTPGQNRAPEPDHFPGQNRTPGRNSTPEPDRFPDPDHLPEPAHDTPLSAAPAAPGTPRGPATALAAERARHARMVVVGAVTERWAPEQAGPVHENWQLAAPIGPATDLWALGALLFRAVQGHAPYPEDSTAELVQLVCAEPPAFAEECGPLRPVVESLLRQDPTERLDFEELAGWLRSLVRSAPEPEAGAHVVPAPPYDAGRLPVVRRRGEVVRKRRSAAPAATGQGHGRHKHKRGKVKEAKAPRAPREARLRESAPPRAPRPRAPRSGGGGQPRSLGRLLLLAILVGLAAAVVYAMLFMPKSDEGASGDRAGSAGEASSAPGTDGGGGDDEPGDKSKEKPKEKPKDKPTKTRSQEPQTSGSELPQGFALRKDAEGFRVAVASGWDRQPKNGRGQVRYTHGGFELLLVPGRDGTDSYGSDPMKYQREHERELQPFRDSSWATSSGMRRIDVGGRAMAEGQFTWQDADGRELFVRNLAMVVAGKYHVVQVRGPEAERDEVTRLYEQASATYQVVD
ncbi:protein kinase [Streptomyces sp. NPDC059002]|uniref:protein kinase n=1 Tax=Streptomyces sp. NPDC059002 TaxID=3346690 RepID=UPI0036C56700